MGSSPTWGATFMAEKRPYKIVTKTCSDEGVAGENLCLRCYKQWHEEWTRNPNSYYMGSCRKTFQTRLYGLTKSEQEFLDRWEQEIEENKRNYRSPKGFTEELWEAIELIFCSLKDSILRK